MQRQLNILLAVEHYLVREGLQAMVAAIPGAHKLRLLAGIHELPSAMQHKPADVLVIDYSSPCFSLYALTPQLSKHPQLQVLAITDPQSADTYQRALGSGIKSHLLRDCDRQEITDALYATAAGEKFFCAKVLNVLMGKATPTAGYDSREQPTDSCDPVQLSARELEITSLVAAGMSTKQVADKLCLSNHTVNTHRKNIMRKLQVSNTAGLVMYAVKASLVSGEGK